MKVADKHEIKLMYEKNLSFLTEWLKDSVQRIDEQDLWNRVKVEYSNEGNPVCIYHHEGKRIHITSGKPVDEARQWRESIPNIEGTGAIFLYGSGFGYPIFEIFANKKAHTLVVVFEEDIYLFKAMLYYFDFEPIFKSGKIVFLIGDCTYYANAFEQLFFSVYFISCTYPVVAVTLMAQRNFKEQYKKIHKDVFTKLALLAFYMGNDHKDNLIGFNNIMANVQETINNPNIRCLKGQYPSCPAFIVANGPSLDKNIQKLKDIKGRGLIICMESASIPLLKNGITPDVLAVIERIKASYIFHFQNICYPDDIALLGLAVADPRIFATFPGEKIPVYRDKEIVNQWISEKIGDGCVIDAGANVSHLAVELALYMGANPVILVGQDYAYGPGQVTHSKDSVYSEEKGRKSSELIQSRPTMVTEGSQGSPVYSNELWLNFKKGLEMKIAQHTEITFINATEGGAKIIGTTCAKLEDAIRQYCIHPIPCRVNQLIREHRIKLCKTNRKEGIEELIESVKHYRKAFREAALEVNKARLDCKRVLSLLSENDNGQYNHVLDEAYQRNVSIFNRLIMDGMFRCFLQQIAFSNYYMINRLIMIDTPEKIKEVFRIHDNFFSQLCVVCQSVSVHFENCVAPLTDLLGRMSQEESGEVE